MSLLLLGVTRPEFTGVLDLVGVSAQVAYSFRKLRAGYSGSAVRVRRSSDNAEQDFGFNSAGDLDMVAVLAFCGANNGFIVTWYDQSGNGLNQTQSTAASQPKLRGTGSVIPGEESPRVELDGTTFLKRDLTAFTMQSVNAVCQPTNFTGSNRTICDHNNNTSGTRWLLRFASTSGIVVFQKSVGVSAGASSTAAQVITGVGTSQLWRDGTSLGTGSAISGATSGTFNIGASPLGGGYFLGTIAEVIVFSSDLTTTQRQTLERNQGTYYGITVA